MTWLIRNAQAVRVSSSPDDQLEGRAVLGGRVDRAVADGRISVLDGFEIIRAHRTGDAVELVGHRRGEVVTHTTDIVVNATGFRPDLDMLREIRLELDEIVEAPKRLAPLIDPNVHSCGTVEPHGFRELTHPEKGFFVVGHEVLRARTHFPARHGIRAGAFGDRVAGRRHGFGVERGTGAARDRSVLNRRRATGADAARDARSAA